MQNVVLDTNALLLPFEESINLTHQLNSLIGVCDIHVPKILLGELKRSKNKFAASAMQLASMFILDDTDELGDYAVIELSSRLNAYAVTNDMHLIKKLRDRNIPVIRFKNHHLVFDE